MRLYYEIARRSFRRAAVYRSAYLFGIITNAFFGALITYVYRALYAAGGTVAGWTLNDAVSYAWTTQSMISIGGAWIGFEIAGTVRTGEVITDLSRPWSFWGYWLSRSVGERLYNLLLRATVTYIVGVVLFGARIPTLFDASVFMVALTLAVLVSYCVSFIINLSAFWLVDAVGIMYMINIVMTFFSGFLMPLDFFPPPLRFIANILPFQAITSVPSQIWLGKLPLAEILPALLLQLGWIVVLTLLSFVVLGRAMRKVVIQGG